MNPLEECPQCVRSCWRDERKYWTPTWLSRKTYPSQHGAFLKHDASWDFCLWWSSQWRHNYLQIQLFEHDGWKCSCWAAQDQWDEVAQTVIDCARSLLPLCWLVTGHRQCICTKFSAGKTSIRSPASKEIMSASVLLGKTTVCFMYIHESGTGVLLPNMHKTPPDFCFRRGIFRVAC